MANGVVVALAEELAEPEVVGGVQTAGQRTVVERVEARRGVLAQRLRVGDLAEPDRAEALQSDRDGLELRGAGRPRWRLCAPGPLPHGGEVSVIERIAGELDLEVGGRPGRIAQLVQSAQ